MWLLRKRAVGERKQFSQRFRRALAMIAVARTGPNDPVQDHNLARRLSPAGRSLSHPVVAIGRGAERQSTRAMPRARPIDLAAGAVGSVSIGDHLSTRAGAQGFVNVVVDRVVQVADHLADGLLLVLHEGSLMFDCTLGVRRFRPQPPATLVIWFLVSSLFISITENHKISRSQDAHRNIQWQSM